MVRVEKFGKKFYDIRRDGVILSINMKDKKTPVQGRKHGREDKEDVCCGILVVWNVEMTRLVWKKKKRLHHCI